MQCHNQIKKTIDWMLTYITEWNPEKLHLISGDMCLVYSVSSVTSVFEDRCFWERKEPDGLVNLVRKFKRQVQLLSLHLSVLIIITLICLIWRKRERGKKRQRARKERYEKKEKGRKHVDRGQLRRPLAEVRRAGCTSLAHSPVCISSLTVLYLPWN